MLVNIQIVRSYFFLFSFIPLDSFKNNNCYAVSEERGSITVQRETSFSWKASENAITCLSWSWDDEILAAGGADFGVSLWNLDKSLCRKLPSVHDSGISSVSFNPLSPFQLLTAERDGRICLQDIRTKPSEAKIFAPRKRQNSKVRYTLNEAQFMPFTPWTMAVLFQDSISLVDSRYLGWQTLESFNCPHSKGFVSCSFDRNGNEIFILANDSQIYSLRTKEFKGYSCFGAQCQVSSFYSRIRFGEIYGNNVLFTTSQNNCCCIWDLKRQIAFQFNGPFLHETSCLDFNWASNELVVCSDDKISCLLTFSNSGEEESLQTEFKEFPIRRFEGQENLLNSLGDDSNVQTPETAKRKKRQSFINWLSP